MTISAAEQRRQHRQRIDDAWALAKTGNETAYRELTMGKTRYIAECAGQGEIPHGMLRRSRKFSNPLFMTPAGYLEAFPELDEHLFLSMDSALAAIRKFSKPEHAALWEIRTTTLARELKDKRYLRWLAEVKNAVVPYKEPKRSIEEVADIYRAGGLDALKAIYTKAHALKLEKRLVETRLIPFQPPPTPCIR